MIKIEGNSISLKQGETGSVRYYFKNKSTDFPFILRTIEQVDTTNLQSSIFFTVRETQSLQSKEIIKRIYIIPIENDNDPVAPWHRFNTTEITELPEEATDIEPNRLYYYTEGSAVGFKFYLEDSESEELIEYEYDYPQSSLNIDFETDDTKDLPYKQYYYELAYVEGYDLQSDEPQITLKNTLLESTPFIVTGALIG